MKKEQLISAGHIKVIKNTSIIYSYQGAHKMVRSDWQVGSSDSHKVFVVVMFK